MVAVRKGMEYVFTERELKYLDDPMPEITLRKSEDMKKKKEQLAKVCLLPEDYLTCVLCILGLTM